MFNLIKLTHEKINSMHMYGTGVYAIDGFICTGASYRMGKYH